MASIHMRGLRNYIVEIRECRSSALETARVNLELAKIRSKFMATRQPTSYNLRKYVAKLMYTHLLGYEVDFGHIQIGSLISSDSFADKQIGYLAAELLFEGRAEMAFMISQQIINDMRSDNPLIQAIAMHCAGTIADESMAEYMIPVLQDIILDVGTKTSTRKKACLCLLRMYRQQPIFFDHSSWSETFIDLLQISHTGSTGCVVALLAEMAANEPEAFEEHIPTVISILHDIQDEKIPAEYIYHRVPAPWLQAACLKYLRCYPYLTGKPLDHTVQLLESYLAQSDFGSADKNTSYGILFSTICITLGLDNIPDSDKKKAAEYLGKFVRAKHPNLKMLGLQGLKKFAHLSVIQHIIQTQSQAVLELLDNRDNVIARAALQLIVASTNLTTLNDNTLALLEFLQRCPMEMKKDVVDAVAYICEKNFCEQTGSEYISTVMMLVWKSSEFVADEIWHRLIAHLTGHVSLHTEAFEMAVRLLKDTSSGENAVACASYIIGEFFDSAQDMTPLDIFELLKKKMNHTSNSQTQNILIMAMGKLAVGLPMLKPLVLEFLTPHALHYDIEVQTKAIEIAALLKTSEAPDVLDAIPMFDFTVLDQATTKSEDGFISDDEESVQPQPSAPISYPDTSVQPQEEQDLFAAVSGSPSAVKQPQPEQVDLLGVFDAKPKPSQQSQPTPPSRPQRPPQERIREWYTSVVTERQGRLYEDSEIELSVQLSPVRDHLTGVRITLHNKCEKDIIGLNVNVEPDPAYTIENVSSGDRVSPGADIELRLVMTAHNLFSELPFTIDYISHAQNTVPLLLPVHATHFLTGQTTTETQAETFWSAYPQCEDKFTFKLPNMAGADIHRAIMSSGLNVVSVKPPATMIVTGVFGFSDPLAVVGQLEVNPAELTAVFSVRSSTRSVSARAIVPPSIISL